MKTPRLGGVVRKMAAVLAVSAAGLTFIANHEGTVNVVYLDPVAIPTVCTGHTRTVSRADVGRSYAPEVCERLLREDTAHAVAGVVRSIAVPISQDQFDALVSFTFNIGNAALHSSSLRRKLNDGDCKGASAEFDRWIYAKRVKLPGLVTRRKDERSLFEQDCP